MWEGGPTVRAFCILMLLMVQFGAYARYFPRIAQIYIILLWKWLKGGSFTCIHATLFSSFFFCLLNLRGATAPIASPGYATGPVENLQKHMPLPNCKVSTPPPRPSHNPVTFYMPPPQKKRGVFWFILFVVCVCVCVCVWL